MNGADRIAEVVLTNQHGSVWLSPLTGITLVMPVTGETASERKARDMPNGGRERQRSPASARLVDSRGGPTCLPDGR
jgi:hypothetical protein